MREQVLGRLSPQGIAENYRENFLHVLGVCEDATKKGEAFGPT